jgi:hypothetical protein
MLPYTNDPDRLNGQRSKAKNSPKTKNRPASTVGIEKNGYTHNHHHWQWPKLPCSISLWSKSQQTPDANLRGRFTRLKLYALHHRRACIIRYGIGELSRRSMRACPKVGVWPHRPCNVQPQFRAQHLTKNQTACLSCVAKRIWKYPFVTAAAVLLSFSPLPHCPLLHEKHQLEV